MKKGFTLAEVLITLSIIAVLSILTLPSLVKEYKYKIYGSTIEKTYSQLSDATTAIMNDEITNSFYKTSAGVKNDTECTKGACYFLNNYFKVARANCSKLTPSCIASEYHSLNSEYSTGLPVFGSYCVQLTTGAVICMVLNTNISVTSVFIDTNGAKEPNIAGLDAYVMSIKPNGSVLDISTNIACCKKKCSGHGHILDYATGCLTKVMNNDWKVSD